MREAYTRRAICAAGGPALLAAGVGLTAAGRASTGGPAAKDVVAQLAAVAAGDLIAGRGDTRTRGVAMLANPTLVALKAAVASDCNLILSPESPFYARPADAASMSGSFGTMAQAAVQALDTSPAYKMKAAFIAEHDLAIYRVTPILADTRDVSADALAAVLGWTGFRRSGALPIYTPPGLTVGAVATLAQERLGAAGGLRFIGDPQMRVRAILLAPGTAEVVSCINGLKEADALLTGDLREWELVEYAHDSLETETPKALIAIGRILSERPFVARCRSSIAAAFPALNAQTDTPVDPFWRVQA